MNDFNEALNAVFKYAASHTDLLKELETNPEQHTAGSHLRGVTADALDDAAGELSGDERKSLEAQARLLRSEHPIYFWRGGVHRANDRQGDPFRDSRWMGFDSGYSSAALNHSPLHPETDPEGLEGTISDHWEWYHLPKPLRKELEADAKHFFHSYSHLIPYGTEYAAGQHFFDRRNQLFDWTFENDPNIPPALATQLDDAADKAGPYTLHIEEGTPPDHHTPPPQYVVGEGGDHHWGQQPGLPE